EAKELSQLYPSHYRVRINLNGTGQAILSRCEFGHIEGQHTHLEVKIAYVGRVCSVLLRALLDCLLVKIQRRVKVIFEMSSESNRPQFLRAVHLKAAYTACCLGLTSPRCK